VAAAGAKGLVVGLSGGIDSACTAALAQRAMGKAALGVLMPCYSDPIDAQYAALAASTLQLETVTVDLGPVYDSMVAALPKITTLSREDESIRIARANIKPRLRMNALYFISNALNYLVAGTGNKSELMVGYFTKYGDGGVDMEPLGDLYKGQVRQLARALGIPQPIIDRPPTAGLWPGQTDEDEMGITYDRLDATLAAIEAGETGNVEPALLLRVEKLIAASEHKRNPPPFYRIDQA
jgi:NAD+ synthase